MIRVFGITEKTFMSNGHPGQTETVAPETEAE